MAEDFDNHRRILNGGDDLQAAAAVGAVFNVDVEDPFEQSCPTQACRRALRVSVLAGCLGGTLWRSGNDFIAQLGVGRQSELALSHSTAMRGSAEMGARMR